MRWILYLTLLSIALAGCRASHVKATDIPDLPLQDPTEIEPLSTSLPAGLTQGDDMPKDPPLTIPRSHGQSVLIERAKVDLAQRISIPAPQIKALETKEASWSDASLGCPQPGIVYAQIPTPGYVVVLEYAGNVFEYHVGDHGNVLYCETPTTTVSGTPAGIYPFRAPAP